jgi:hypothetical protein
MRQSALTSHFNARKPVDTGGANDDVEVITSLHRSVSTSKSSSRHTHAHTHSHSHVKATVAATTHTMIAQNMMKPSSSNMSSTTATIGARTTLAPIDANTHLSNINNHHPLLLSSSSSSSSMNMPPPPLPIKVKGPPMATPLPLRPTSNSNNNNNNTNIAYNLMSWQPKSAAEVGTFHSNALAALTHPFQHVSVSYVM